MSYSWFRVVALALAAVVVAGCSKPETPQEVAAEFWQALSEKDADTVADLSTLAAPLPSMATPGTGLAPCLISVGWSSTIAKLRS